MNFLNLSTSPRYLIPNIYQCANFPSFTNTILSLHIKLLDAQRYFQAYCPSTYVIEPIYSVHVLLNCHLHMGLNCSM